VWKELGHSAEDEHRRKAEEQLTKLAETFACEKGKHKEFLDEMSWLPDYSACEKEWEDMRKQLVPPLSHSRALEDPTVQNWVAWNGETEFTMCLPVVRSERHIGLDQGTQNFGIAVVDKFEGTCNVHFHIFQPTKCLSLKHSLSYDHHHCRRQSSVLISLHYCFFANLKQLFRCHPDFNVH
jgi:hypothetical protein